LAARLLRRAIWDHFSQDRKNSILHRAAEFAGLSSQYQSTMDIVKDKMKALRSTLDAYEPIQKVEVRRTN
jgi:hypothetical protein